MISSPSEARWGREGISELAEILVYQKTLDGTAHDVIELARSSLENCDGVGVQLVDRNGLTARVFTDSRSSELDAMQERLDEGPCVDCLRTGEVRDMEPVTSDERWPVFAPSAREAGLMACLALPLTSQDVLLGVLNLYAWPMRGFAGWDRPHCSEFAEHASVSLANAQAYARSQVIITQLEAALAVPDDIVEQAHGVLMAREHATLEKAEARLSDLAGAHGGSLERAAQAVLDSLAET